MFILHSCSVWVQAQLVAMLQLTTLQECLVSHWQTWVLLQFIHQEVVAVNPRQSVALQTCLQKSLLLRQMTHTNLVAGFVLLFLYHLISIVWPTLSWMAPTPHLLYQPPLYPTLQQHLPQCCQLQCILLKTTIPPLALSPAICLCPCGPGNSSPIFSMLTRRSSFLAGVVEITETAWGRG